MMFEHDSIADIHEDKLVEYLLAVPYWRNWMFGHHGIPRDPICRNRVPLSTVPGGLPRQGDIDVLLCSPDRFEAAVAYQVKRVKVSLAQLQAKTPGKLKGIQEGVQQANDLAELGFWKVYLYIIAEIDARELDILDGDRPHFNEIIYKIDSAIGISMGNLNRRIGINSFEFVQTTDSDPHTIDHSHGNLRRPGAPVTQSYELTKWVSEQLLQAALKAE
jgi:hypothetical protein